MEMVIGAVGLPQAANPTLHVVPPDASVAQGVLDVVDLRASQPSASSHAPSSSITAPSPSCSEAAPATSIAALAIRIAASLVGSTGAVLPYYPPYPQQPSDQPNAERIRWLKQQIEYKTAECGRLKNEQSRAESERQCKLREKERYESESYSLGQQINKCEYDEGQRQIELDRVKEKLRYGKDLPDNERWSLETRRGQLVDDIYRLSSQAKDLQYKRNDVDYKSREAASAADSLQRRYWELGAQHDSVKNEMQALKDELWRLERA